MKRKLLKLTMTVALATTVTAVNAQNVNIPDANFKAYLVGNTAINTNMDSEIQVSEAAAYTGAIYCQYLDISSLTGIESFTQIATLRCDGNLLTSLDVSNNTALTGLNCDANPLTSLDVSNNINLEFLFLNNTLISSINLTQNTALEELACVEGQMASITLGANTALTHIYCRDNQITSLNLSQCTALTELHCEENSITSLDLSMNTSLSLLLCHTNELSSLNVANNVNLTDLRCYQNQLTTLTTGTHPNLFRINARDNDFTSLDLSNLGALTEISLENNTNLSSLNLANNNNTIITYLNIANTALECVQVDDQTYSNTNWNVAPFNLDGAICLEDCASAGINEFNTENELNIFPNPATANITLTNLTIGSTLQLTDMTGKTVLETLVSSSEMNLDVNNLNNGVYFVELVNNSEITTAKKLVVNK